MTIEMSVFAQHGDYIKIGTVPPGELGSFSDFSDGTRKTLVVHCREDNMGGEVYCMTEDAFEESLRYRAIPLHLFTEENLEAVIEQGETYERDIVTRLRQFGRLILSHQP